MSTNFIDLAKELRRNSTEAEKLLWRFLRARQFEGLKSKRQQPMGKYIVDFVCFEKRIIIELDGGQHAIEKDKDIERDKWFQEQGFRVLRFWNNDVLGNIEGIIEVIRAGVLSPYPASCIIPPHPNPLGEGIREIYILPRPNPQRGKE